eukprot:2856304-Prymnesium_polylepis.1
MLSFDLAGDNRYSQNFCSMVKIYERNLGGSATQLCPKAIPHPRRSYSLAIVTGEAEAIGS